MTEIGIFQILIYFSLLVVLIKPLGLYFAKIYGDNFGDRNNLFTQIEKIIYKLCGIEPKQEMDWIKYLIAMLIFNFFGFLAVYFLQRIQFFLPLNPQSASAVSPSSAFNTAVSFISNTDWQAYSGETTMSYLTQMLALTVQNFISAATGMSLLMALIRGIARHGTINLGNFWIDMVRSVLYVLLPLSIILAVTLVSQGVIQNFKPYEKVTLLEKFNYQKIKKDTIGNKKIITMNIQNQIIPMGPVASQIAIKQLGSNGGGFFNTNSAHPFENPTPFSNFLEMLAILLIPASLCYTFGVMVKDTKQGLALLAAMFLIYIPLTFVCMLSEQAGNPALSTLETQQASKQNLYSGGNMEGKETRFGIISSVLWASATTATSNGSVNSMHDSYTPLGGMILLWLMHLGEVVFGGVGSGLYGMLLLVIITVFVAGLMVGRTPEYLGKKIEPYEMQMASMAVLVMPLTVLLFTAIAVVTKAGTDSILNPGAHGFSEILYAFTSMGNNNGSAFAGLNVNTFFYNLFGGITMLIGRYWIAIPTLAIAGSLAKKKKIPVSLGTLSTHTPLFIILLVGITLILGALTFFPALALGPIAEHLMLWNRYGH